ncbi:MAG: response regulator transcription factor [Anaerolineae bacterium]|nr:response regulator transcription factor [Anaerolineae bacterium]
MIRVILADDHHLVRQGIRALLEKANDINIVDEAEDGQEAVTLVEQLKPDVLIIDIAMPRMNGIQATQRVRALGLTTQVVILSMHSRPTLVRQALRNGARGYLLKNSITEELLLAVRAANRRETYLSPEVSGIVVDDFLTHQVEAEQASSFNQLTPREREVVQLIAEGHTNNGIARLLNISVKTVERHRANLMAKLDVHDVAGLTRVAIELGLIFIDE